MHARIEEYMYFYIIKYKYDIYNQYDLFFFGVSIYLEYEELVYSSVY